MTHRNTIRVLRMPAQEVSYNDTHASRNEPSVDTGALVARLEPALSSMIRESIGAASQQSTSQSWLREILHPKNVLAAIAFAFSLGGAFVVWSKALVTEDSLDAKMAPIIDAIKENTQNIAQVQLSVSDLVVLQRRQDKIAQATNALSRFEADYARRVASWSKTKKGQYPQKSSEHILAEIELEKLRTK